MKRGHVRAVMLASAGACALGVSSVAFAQASSAPSATTPVQSPQTGAPIANDGTSAPDQASVVNQASPATDTAETGDIVVTGIRGSLQSSTRAKRDSVAFGESIFAEDIGKLPATNLAETLNRIPGVRLNRDITGEGLQVAIRGLGPSFTKVLLNGANFQIASDGGTQGGSSNREVDLDFFPSELFTRLDVAKSPVASVLEGGVAGTVNLRNARPFDRPGTHYTVVAQGQYSDSADKVSPRGAFVASHTTDTLGILVGVSGISVNQRVDSFDSIGWTDANLPCGTGCNASPPEGNGFFYANVVPRNVGRGLVAGQAYDPTVTSGLNLQQLSKALIPRLARNVTTYGKRERLTLLTSLEWRPSDQLNFALDGIAAKATRDYTRANMNFQVRNTGPGTSATSTGGMVPFDLKIDGNNVVTSGTFGNASFFGEFSEFEQETRFWNINPSVSWRPTELLRVDLQSNYGKSRFYREQPSFIVQTPRESGVEAYFDNSSTTGQPIVTSNRNLADPNLGWQWYRLNVNSVRRETTTKGAHLDLSYGDRALTVKIGAAFDQAQRSIRAFDNSTAYQTAVCGAGCFGTSGFVPNSQLGQYLTTLPFNNLGKRAPGDIGYTQFILPRFGALKDATNYQQFLASAPEARGAVTGGATGDIKEKVYGAYLEINGQSEIFGRTLRANAGFRYVYTDQVVTSPSQVGTALVDITDSANYEEVLPSVNLTYDVTDRLKLRFSASKTLTRPEAGSLLPGLTFSDPSAQTASAGNPELSPFISRNLDVGGEFYTSSTGYIGLVAFRKNIEGFTLTQQQQVAFGDLNIPIGSLQTTQQNALNDRSRNTGVAVAALPITVNRPVNLQDLIIEGVEATWVQPLDFLTKGLGFSVNGTHLRQKSPSGLVATGVSPYLANLQGFYENFGLSISVNYVWQDRSTALNPPQYNLPLPVRTDARGQLDLSAGYQLPFANKAFRVTLDVLNITNEPIRNTFGYDNVTWDAFYPGRQVLVGVRANF